MALAINPKVFIPEENYYDPTPWEFKTPTGQSIIFFVEDFRENFKKSGKLLGNPVARIFPDENDKTRCVLYQLFKCDGSFFMAALTRHQQSERASFEKLRGQPSIRVYDKPIHDDNQMDVAE